MPFIYLSERKILKNCPRVLFVPFELKVDFLNVTTMSSTFTDCFPLVPHMVPQDFGPLIVAIIVNSSFGLNGIGLDNITS